MKPFSVLSFAAELIAMMLCASVLRAQVSFPGPELLGRPTDHSVTLNVVANAAIQAYIEYGTQQGGPYPSTSPSSGASAPASAAANAPLVLELTGLSPNTQYFYRLIYRQTGTSTWTTRSEYSFYTQRPAGSTFSFTITSDSHINIVFGTPSLFQQTLQNIAGEKPDFNIDLGDTFAMDNVTSQATANSNYLNIRQYFGVMSPSVPLFLALGNHEQEEGWHMGETTSPTTDPPVMSANARNLYYLNPDPLTDSFYSGNTDVSTSSLSGDHSVGDYYAWQWGDALFVVYDPYWYSTTKPFIGNMGGGEDKETGSGDRWDWTLGATQYQWLEQTLKNSNAKYKFLFNHQVAGGLDDYGRGGAYAVPFVEWGGYNDDGTTWAFDSRRSGWDAPVHDLLVKYNVTAVFHGHDHEFAYETRDGIVYQLVPMAADATYGYGFGDYTEDGVYTLKVLPNSGHLRVTVSPTQVTVDYVRAFLSGAGTNNQIAYTYNIAPTVTTPDFSLAVAPGSQTVAQGGSTSYTATVGALNSFAGTVGLSVTGLPNGASAGTGSVSGAGTATLNVTTSGTTPGGTYTLTITGTSGGLTHTATTMLVVNPPPDFSLSATPNSQTVTQGGSTSYTATVGALYGFTGTVGLSVTGTPSGVTAGGGSVTGSGTATLNVATSSTTPTGSYTLTITGASGGLTHTATVTLVVNTAQSNPPQQETLLTTQTPQSTNLSDGAGANYELGMKFTSAVAGQITAIRFYKGSSESGTHTGHIWSSTGTQLASVTFTGETASGWQQQNLSTPLSISANTTYVATVNTGNTYYNVTDTGFATQIVSGDLKSVVGGNGVYGNAGSFPASTYLSSNYFRDVVFTPSTTQTYSISGTVTGAGGATLTLTSGGSTAATLTAGASGATYTFTGLRNGSYTVTPSLTGYTFAPTNSSVTVSGANVTGVNFTASASSPTSESLFTAQTPALTGLSDGPTANYELGMRFQSGKAGKISAIRFWKDAQETGTHTGHIWSASGSLLATVTFTNETTSGWQVQNLTTPLSISASTTYVVSVTTGNTYYVVTDTGFATQIVNGDLKSVVGGNGVYGNAGVFPASTYLSSNYFRDVVFSPN